MPHLRQAAVRLAKSADGIPYIWGGNKPAEGFDCSGFVIWILQVMGVLKSGDWTAQSMHDMFRDSLHGLPLDPTEGNLVFYGRKSNEITHVMLTIGAGQCIGASGGTRQTLTRDFALNIGAKVKTKYLHYRNDLACIIPVHYPDEQ